MKIIQKESIDSTNAYAKLLLETEHKSPFWIAAERQTNGRGRYQRKWISDKGNLFCSRVYSVGNDLKHSSNLSFVAALAVAETLLKFVSPETIKIKWPNDVLLRGKKVSGILLESFNYRNKNYIIIGIGINLSHHPEGNLYPATNLLDNISAKSFKLSPSGILDILVDRFETINEIYLKEGFTAVREQWLKLSHNIPGEVEVKLFNENFSGRAMGIDLNGSLLVTLPDGTIRNVSAGDVFFGSEEDKD